MDKPWNSEQDQALKEESLKRTNAEGPLVETNEIFGLLINAVTDYAIFSLDVNGIIQTWNPGGIRLKGYAAQEIIGQHFSRFYTESDKAINHPHFELEQAKVIGTYEEEGWRVKKDGSTFWASVVITALRDNQGLLRGFAKVTRDLTQKKLAEDELKRAYESLELRVEERTNELAHAKVEADKAVKARDEFLSIASHELNTPLTSLKLQIQLRKKQLSNGNTTLMTPEGIEKMIKSDEKQINRLSRLVDDMLDISRLNSGSVNFKKSVVDINQLVAEIASRFSAQLVALGVPLIIESKKAVAGFWDQHRIDQVITNLLTNAMKYGDNKPISIRIDADEYNALISVTDQGIGISPEDQSRVFQQYERAVSANAVSGLGLGLFIVNQILVGHKATIVLTSELGKGSTFLVTLPLKSE